MNTKDLECPYCGTGLDVCHDDGQGYEEGVKHQMECNHCGKTFVFYTSISFYYEPEKADCLNDGKHDYQLTNTARMQCSICDDERVLTDKERTDLGIGTQEDYFKKLRQQP